MLSTLLVQVLRVDPVAVMDRASISVISVQGLAELLQRPFRCGIRCRVVMHDPACSDLHDHE
jgi:hypothetical protein